MGGYAVFASLMRYLFLALAIAFIAASIIYCLREGALTRAKRRLTGYGVRFIVISAPEEYAGMHFAVTEDLTTIGSGEDADIRFTGASLGSNHAELIRRRGEVLLRTRQRHFAELNGNPLSSATVSLHDGDTVWIKDLCFMCKKSLAKGGDGNG